MFTVYLGNQSNFNTHFARLKYKNKFKEFEQRYESLETAQVGLKLKLVEFNNFVKEKQEKIKEGRLQIRTEKKSRVEKQVVLDYLVQRRELLSESLTLLSTNIERRNKYSDFLEEVVRHHSGRFENIEKLLERFTALLDLKIGLTRNIDDFDKATKETKNSLEKFREDKMRETLILNIKLVNPQRKACTLQAKTLERKTFLGQNKPLRFNFYLKYVLSIA